MLIACFFSTFLKYFFFWAECYSEPRSNTTLYVWPWLLRKRLEYFAELFFIRYIYHKYKDIYILYQLSIGLVFISKIFQNAENLYSYNIFILWHVFSSKKDLSCYFSIYHRSSSYFYLESSNPKIKY